MTACGLLAPPFHGAKSWDRADDDWVDLVLAGGRLGVKTQIRSQGVRTDRVGKRRGHGTPRCYKTRVEFSPRLGQLR